MSASDTRMVDIHELEFVQRLSVSDFIMFLSLSCNGAPRDDRDDEQRWLQISTDKSAEEALADAREKDPDGTMNIDVPVFMANFDRVQGQALAALPKLGEHHEGEPVPDGAWFDVKVEDGSTYVRLNDLGTDRLTEVLTYLDKGLGSIYLGVRPIPLMDGLLDALASALSDDDSVEITAITPH